MARTGKSSIPRFSLLAVAGRAPATNNSQKLILLYSSTLTPQLESTVPLFRRIPILLGIIHTPYRLSPHISTTNTMRAAILVSALAFAAKTFAQAVPEG